MDLPGFVAADSTLLGIGLGQWQALTQAPG